MRKSAFDFVTELENLEKQAGEEGWGGEFREDLFDTFLNYFRYQHLLKHPTSLSGLLRTLVDTASSWMVSDDKETQQ